MTGKRRFLDVDMAREGSAILRDEHGIEAPPEALGDRVQRAAQLAPRGLELAVALLELAAQRSEVGAAVGRHEGALDARPDLLLLDRVMAHALAIEAMEQRRGRRRRFGPGAVKLEMGGKRREGREVALGAAMEAEERFGVVHAEHATRAA